MSNDTDTKTLLNAIAAVENVQRFDTALLVAIVNGEVDIKDLAGEALASRGLNADGQWVGFKAAREEQARRTKTRLPLVNISAFDTSLKLAFADAEEAELLDSIVSCLSASVELTRQASEFAGLNPQRSNDKLLEASRALTEVEDLQAYLGSHIRS
jgi:hypothetical protein